MHSKKRDVCTLLLWMRVSDLYVHTKKNSNCRCLRVLHEDVIVPRFTHGRPVSALLHLQFVIEVKLPLMLRVEGARLICAGDIDHASA